MKRSLFSLLSLLILIAAAQSAEIMGVADTLPHSPEAEAQLYDESVGEKLVRVRATDAGGNALEGAPVMWTVTNRSANPVFVVSVSGLSESTLIQVGGNSNFTFAGGNTNEVGEAYLVVDSATSGDTSIGVTVDGSVARGYDEADMRVVWF